MRIVQDPLSEEETAEARALLEESGGKYLSFARGVFAAVATAPNEVAPPDWLPMLLGEQVPSASHLKRLLALLMREYNACADCLALSVPWVPPPDDSDALVRFAKGYVQIAQRDELWSKDPEAFELTAPLMLLSGYAEPSSLESIVSEFAQDPEGYRKRHLLELQEDLVQLYLHFSDKRAEKEQKTAESDAKVAKVGRNDPCPCGSGNKFKKCCAAGEGNQKS